MLFVQTSNCVAFPYGCVLYIPQRLVGFSILCDLYRNEANGTNPFLPVFLEALESGSDQCEKQFLVHLLCSPPSNRDVSNLMQNLRNTSLIHLAKCVILFSLVLICRVSLFLNFCLQFQRKSARTIIDEYKAQPAHVDAQIPDLAALRTSFLERTPPVPGWSGLI